MASISVIISSNQFPSPPGVNKTRHTRVLGCTLTFNAMMVNSCTLHGQSVVPQKYFPTDFIPNFILLKSVLVKADQGSITLFESQCNKIGKTKLSLQLEGNTQGADITVLNKSIYFYLEILGYP